MKLANLNTWVKNTDKPLVIAGPCSAESEEQLQTTAKALAQLPQVAMLRAGIWKPRTRPGEFEGLGEKALPWLVDAAKANDLPSTAEIANAKHAELALKAGVDVLWIGARTTVNPFSVQEIADALQGVDIPVMIKNPVNPDLGLWTGAIERINRAGIDKIAAIHRGFSPVGKSAFRNDPMWELPINLKRNIPDLPIICDPSHIAGDRTLIATICQRALDLDMQGLMVETHPTPDKAWTDAKQQVSPEHLGLILENLVIRERATQDPGFISALEQLRQDIDLLDEKVIQVLAQRMKLVGAIGEYKRDNKVTILQVNRWNDIIASRSKYAQALDLDKEFVLKMLELVHSESIRKQNEIMNQKAPVKEENA